MQTFTFSHGVAMFLPIAAAYIADRARAITLNALGAEPFDTSKPSYIPNFIDALEGVTEMPKREILFALALDAAYRIEQNDTNSGFWVREPQGNNIPRLSLNRLPDSAQTGWQYEALLGVLRNHPESQGSIVPHRASKRAWRCSS